MRFGFKLAGGEVNPLKLHYTFVLSLRQACACRQTATVLFVQTYRRSQGKRLEAKG